MYFFYISVRTFYLFANSSDQTAFFFCFFFHLGRPSHRVGRSVGTLLLLLSSLAPLSKSGVICNSLLVATHLFSSLVMAMLLPGSGCSFWGGGKVLPSCVTPACLLFESHRNQPFCPGTSASFTHTCSHPRVTSPATCASFCMSTFSWFSHIVRTVSIKVQNFSLPPSDSHLL